MAYFSNGTEGMDYRERYCERCEHLPEDQNTDCPIWSAHFFHNSDRHTNEAVKSILDMLIPMESKTFKDGITCDFAAECSFFRQKQERLPLESEL